MIGDVVNAVYPGFLTPNDVVSLCEVALLLFIILMMLTIGLVFKHLMKT